MGQQQSNQLSNNSTTPLNPKPNPNAKPNPPGEDISGPARPPLIHRLSELFDPVDLVREDSQALSERTPYRTSRIHAPRRPLVQSPSGHILDAEQFAGHENRPLSMRERQEEIVRRTRAAVERAETPDPDRILAGGQYAWGKSTAQGQAAGTGQGKKKKRGGCLGCC